MYCMYYSMYCTIYCKVTCRIRVTVVQYRERIILSKKCTHSIATVTLILYSACCTVICHLTSYLCICLFQINLSD